MRHQTKGFKLGRTHAHRKATLASLSSALIAHKRITTTLAKARALRMHVEPILNRAKTDTIHNRRQAFRMLGSKHAVKELFGDVAEKIADRPGGYTRIVKLGQRAGDAAEMAIIELVDYNDVESEGAGSKSKTRRTRRSRGGSGKAGQHDAATKAKKTPKATEPAEETVEATSTEVEETVEAETEETVEATSAEEEETVEAASETAAQAESEVEDTDEESSEEKKEDQ